MANQASTSSADSLEQQIKNKHTYMVIRLSKHFDPALKHWEDLLVLLSDVLDPVDLYGKDNSFIKICDKLMANGTISHGSYDKLYEVIRSIDVRPAEIIQKTSDEIKDIQSKGQAEQPRPGRDPTKDRDPKLTAMIETTTDMILKEKDKYEFFSTKSHQDAYDKLMKNSLVIINGNSGDGKTSIALELLRRLCYNEEGQQRRQPLELHDIKDLDSVNPKSQLVIYLDDIFGKNVLCKQDVEEWEKRENSVISNFCGKEHTKGNFLIIAIRRGISNSLTGSCLEKVFTKQNIVNLNIDAKEKLEFLRLYKPKDNFDSWKDDEEKEIVKCAPDIGFPQCCRLFRDTPTLQTERVNFFRRPFYFLKSLLSRLEDGKCYGLMYLFLNGGKLMEYDLDPNNENIDENLLEAAFANDVVKVTETAELVHSRSKRRKIEFVKDSLDCLLGWMVKKELIGKQNCYIFNHDSIEETLALLYGEKTPIGFIQNCPSKFLSDVTTSKTTPYKVVIASDNQFNAMFKRLEFESVYSTKHKNHINLCHEIKLPLLNKACSSGAEECALFLLSEGVKPDEETTFRVAEGGSLNILYKVERIILESLYRFEDEQHKCERVEGRVVHRNCVCAQYMCQLVRRSGRTVLHHSCRWRGHMDVIKYLCKSYPALSTAVDNGGETVLHMSCRGRGHMDVIKYLSESYPELTTAVNQNGYTVLHISCVLGRHMDVIKYLCESYPALTIAVDNDGRTVLHASCKEGHMDVIKYLCKSYPALTTAVDNYGQHCLHFIARNNSDVDLFTECETHVKQYLVSTGGKYDITTILTKRGQSVLDIAKNVGKKRNPLYNHLVRLFGQQKQ